MFDTMTITKIGGALCGALLIFLLINWLAEIVYSTDAGGHGEHAEAAYVIETDDAEDGGEETAEVVDVAALIAAADLAKGEKTFSKCKACHSLEDGKHGTGPSLFGVVDRAIGAIDGFGYSGGMAEHGGNWNAETLFEFLENPKNYVPGTKMGFAGLKKDSDRANLIAYLATVK